MNTSKAEIYVIIPCYNEASVVRNTVTDVLKHGYNVVVVDDCSKDHSKKQLQGLPIYYLRHRANMGQGAALHAGLEFAKRKGASYFVTFDADGQHDSNDIDGMFEELLKNKADIVFASRFLPGAKTNISGARSFVLNVARYVNYLVSGILLSDAYNGLRVFNAKTAGILKITENKMAHATEIQMLAAHNKLSYCEFPNHIQYNDYTKRKGLKNIDGLKIVFEILLFKIFR